MPKKQQRSFDELWSTYLNEVEEGDLQEAFVLADCLAAAKTFDEALKVYLSALDSREEELKGLGSRALHKMILLASNLDEAKRALGHASKKAVGRKYRFPARFKEAEAKLKEFTPR